MPKWERGENTINVFGLPDAPVLEALAHHFTAPRPGKVHHRALCGAYERADLLQPVTVQPTIAAAALNGEAVRFGLVGPAVLVTAFVGVDPEFHCL